MTENGNFTDISYPKFTGYHFIPFQFGNWLILSPNVIKIRFEGSENVGDGVLLHTSSSLYGLIVGLQNFQLKTCIYLVQDILKS